jgi:acetoacetate decarboxylase
MNNIPIHAPLYAPDLIYGSDNCETLTALVKADEDAVRDLLSPTPFEYVAPYAWIEIVVLRTAFGVAPFQSGGVIVPALHPQSGTVGGYYAFCYTDTDESLALGREPYGYPKKYARVTLDHAGLAVIGRIRSESASITLGAALTDIAEPADLPQRYPHLLLQVIPGAESNDILLKRVIARNTGAASTFFERFGDGAVEIEEAMGANELAWLKNCAPVTAAYGRGRFRSAYGEVLETIEVGPELLRHLASKVPVGEGGNG